MAEPQNYQNHARRQPPIVFVVFFALLANILWSGYRLVTTWTIDWLMTFLVGVSIVILAFVARIQSLTVQNRVIRLEMRHRMRDLLSPEAFALARDLPVEQIIALRFAGDAELPELVDAVLSGSLKEPKAIKQKVADWQADHLRA